MRIERRITHSEPESQRELRRQAAITTAKRQYPNADRVEAHTHGGQWYVEIWRAGRASIFGVYGGGPV